jgi:hypothetical protein
MTWPPADARELGDANEIDVVVPAPGRDDVRTPIWIVAVDGDLYVRSSYTAAMTRPPATSTTLRLDQA